jgi:Mg-chelatase subunit ChlD
MSDNYELDKGDNLIFALDVSASMNRGDTPTGQSRLDYSKEKAIALANEASKYDEDGVDILTFGERVKNIGKATGNNAGDLIGALRATEGSTDTAGAIRAAYEIHKKNSYKQTFLFLVTDGEPNSREDVKEAVRTIAAEVKDEHEFAIGLIIVGEPDSGLSDFLKELDDNLKAKLDIVDVKRFAEVDSLVALAAGALHD